MRQIGWFDPATKRFCYTDERAKWPDRRATYTVPVYAGKIRKVDVVFTGEQPHLEFVEVEDSATLASVSIGQWSVEAATGFHRLTIEAVVPGD